MEQSKLTSLKRQRREMASFAGASGLQPPVLVRQTLFRSRLNLLHAGASPGSGHGCIVGRARLAAFALGIGVGELGTKQEDLRGVVDPQQDQNQRPGRTKSRSDAALADVESQQIFAS